MRMSSGGKTWKDYFSFKNKKGKIERWWSFYAKESFMRMLDKGYLHCRLVRKGKLIMRSATYKGE